MAASETDKKVGEAVLAMRKERDLSRAEFARRVGKDVDQLDRYLSGQQPFPLAVLMSSAVELEVGLDDIFRRAGLMPEAPGVESAIESDPALAPGWKATLRASYRAALASPDLAPGRSSLS